jgi:hypothetical protein
LPPNGTASGDLSGTYPDPTVISTHLSSALPLAQGGTGSTTKNFVDLSTNQTIAGTKTFSGGVSIDALQLTASPTSGDVLVSDSSGNATWQNPTSTVGQATFTTSGVVKQTVFNVMDYGATGNGATDDHAAFNSAISAANSAGGGIVYAPAGTYVINSPITPMNDVVIRGAGQGSAVLNNTQSTYQLFRHIGYSAGLTNFELHDLQCTAPSGGAPFWYSDGGLSNILFENCTFDGLTGGDDMLGSGMVYSRVKNCTFQNGNGQGTANTGASYCEYVNNSFYSVGNPVSLEGSSYHNLIDGNTSYYCGYFKAGNPVTTDTSYFNIITNNRSYYATSGGIEVGQGIANTVADNIIVRAQNDGIYAACTDSTIKNNKMYQNNFGNSYRSFNSVASNMGGIQIVDASQQASPARNIVEGNVIYGDNSSWTHPVLGTTKSDYTGGIAIDTNYNLTTIANNSVKLIFGVGTSEIIAEGTNNIISNNAQVNPELFYSQGSVSGSTTFNRVNGKVIAATLTGNITVTLTNSLALGTELVLLLTQDSTGSRIATWPSNAKFAQGGLTLSTTANTIDVINLAWDGTNWHEVSRALSTASYVLQSSLPLGVVALTYGSTISANAALGNAFTVTLTGNATMANPTNPIAGQKIVYELTQDSTGSRVITWGSAFLFSNDTPQPVLSTTPNLIDYIAFMYSATSTTWNCIGVSRGY